jgi:hypothetical protein
VKDDAAFETLVAARNGGLQQPRWRMRFVEIDFAVALVGRDDEVVAIGEGDGPAQG